ncbi:hypothetical protein [Phytohabitans aurantiacus]|uniref:Excreted virulence factor EspC, type VII ESX diderm n=1 Tax=Phytohabitans aurantiacus TaxID=3016789 RepID=A0ABQ5QVA2_9ACTN|nr:hypothetical protein [Phytohabitans aurantiacus]GLH98349.1 hypothetical protein Pa4123_36240 [Phytohabitans aurantiacus]
MEALRELAGRFDAAAESLTAASGRLAGLEPPPDSVAAGAPGRLGELGRALHSQWVGALAARAREAAATGGRIADAAGTLRVVAADYAGIDEEARRRQPEVP